MMLKKDSVKHIIAGVVYTHIVLRWLPERFCQEKHTRRFCVKACDISGKHGHNKIIDCCSDKIKRLKNS